MKYTFLCCILFLLFLNSDAQNNADDILGKWESVEKNLTVQVYKQDDVFKAKIIWFHDAADTITPVEERLDTENPDKSLRNRKIIGLDVLSGLVYNTKENKWENGKIYDSSSGKTWNAVIWLSNADTLNVRGYYIFRFLGRTLKFTIM